MPAQYLYATGALLLLLSLLLLIIIIIIIIIIVTQSKCKFGLGVILPSKRHTQCQVTFRNKLRKSGNHNICEIQKSTTNINIQYNQFHSTRDALNHIRSSDVSSIMEKITTQRLVVKSIWEFVDGGFINQWSNVISHLPRTSSISPFAISTTR